MANLDLILQHVKVSEGGLSSDPRDNASSFPSSTYDPKTKKPFHTNKGVTYRTYVNYCNINKRKPTDTEFIKMDDKLWKSILRSLYVAPFRLEEINSQGVAEIIFEAHWGGGGNEMELDLQRYLRQKGFNIAVDGNIGNATLKAVNDYTKSKNNEIDLIKYLTKERLAYLKSLKDWPTYQGGWTKRVLEVEKRALAFVQNAKEIVSENKNTLLGGGLLVGLLALGFLLKNKA
jgi:lysozyme family protein